MATPDTNKPPSAWEALLDYSKAVVTLASALLAITVTFVEKLVSAQSSEQQEWLFAVWTSLLVALVAGVLSAAFSVNYLRKGTKETLAVLCANVSFFALALAALALARVGWISAGTRAPVDSARAIQEARSAWASYRPGEAVEIWSLQRSGDGFEVIIVGAGAAQKYVVTIAAQPPYVAAIVPK